MVNVLLEEIYRSGILLRRFVEEFEKNVYVAGLSGDVARGLVTWLMLNQALNQCKGLTGDYVFPTKIFDTSGLVVDINNLNKTTDYDPQVSGHTIFNRLQLEEACANYVYKMHLFRKRHIVWKHRFSFSEQGRFVFGRVVGDRGGNASARRDIHFVVLKTVKDKLANAYVGSVDAFHDLLASVVVRYNALEGNQMNAAVPKEVYVALDAKYGVTLECFASSLNHYFTPYCSLFYDLEQPFGSVGNFFSQKKLRGFCVANPPFDETLMYLMARKMLKLLDSAERDGAPLSFFVVLPNWTSGEGYGTFRGYKALRASPHTVYSREYTKRQVVFTDYFNGRDNHLTGVYVLVLQNPTARRTAAATDADLDALLRTHWLGRRANPKDPARAKVPEHVDLAPITDAARFIPSEKLSPVPFRKYAAASMSTFERDQLAKKLPHFVSLVPQLNNIVTTQKSKGLAADFVHAYMQFHKTSVLHDLHIIAPHRKKVDRLKNPYVHQNDKHVIDINLADAVDMHKLGSYFTLRSKYPYNLFVFDDASDLTVACQYFLFTLITGSVNSSLILKIPPNASTLVYKLFDFGRSFFRRCVLVTHFKTLYMVCANLKHVSSTDLMGFKQFDQCLHEKSCYDFVINVAVYNRTKHFLNDQKLESIL